MGYSARVRSDFAGVRIVISACVLALPARASAAAAPEVDVSTRALMASIETIEALDFPIDFRKLGTEAEVKLGRDLFFDPRLSADGTMSCSTCHRPDRAFTDGRPRAVGRGGHELPRGVPSLFGATIAATYLQGLFLDGRAATIADAALAVIQNPSEFGNTLPRLEATLKGDPDYARRFAAIYGGDGVRAADAAAALAAFVMSLAHVRPSPYDRLRDDWQALNPSQKRGLLLFAGKAGCKSCHWTPDLTYGEFVNNGLKPLADADDVGRYAVTHAESDWRAIKVPSLRNVALTAPYMHDGRYKTLAEVIEFYDRGGDPVRNRDRRIKPLHLTAGEKKDLEAFLRSLTNPPDESGADFASTSFRPDAAPAPAPRESRNQQPLALTPQMTPREAAPIGPSSRGGGSAARCQRESSPERLLADRAAGRFNADEIQFLERNVLVDLFKYAAYQAFVAEDPALCDRLGDKTYFNGRFCRGKYMELNLLRAMVGRAPDFEPTCLAMAALNGTPDPGARDLCRIMEDGLDDPPGTCPRLLPRFMAPNSLRACRYLFGPLKGEPLDCAPFSDSPTRTERCLMWNSYPPAYRAGDPRLCGGSDACEVLMGGGAAVVARLASRIEAEACGSGAAATGY
jgi:cytochrome c peroxidase